MVYTVEQLIKAGGREWQQGEKHRVYFNNLARWYGVETDRYNSGHISSATLDGAQISNSKARDLLIYLGDAKLWYDLGDQKFHGLGLKDTKHFLNIFPSIVGAIKAQIARDAEEEASRLTGQTTISALDMEDTEFSMLWTLPVTIEALQEAGVELAADVLIGPAALVFGVDCDPYDAGRDEVCIETIGAIGNRRSIARYYTNRPGQAGITAIPPRLRNEQRMWGIVRERVTDMQEALDRVMAEYREACDIRE